MHEEWYNVDTWGGRKFPNTSNKECRSVMIQLKWANNLEVKRDLTELVCSCFLTDDRGNLFEISVIISSGENTWRVTKKDCYRKIDFSQLININTFYDNFEKRNIGISSPATRYHQ